MDYKEDIKLDKDNLDLEWEKQSNLIQEYAESVSMKSKELNDFSQILKQKEASIRLDYRTGKKEILMENGKPLKLTESGLNEVIDTDVELIELNKQYNMLKYELDIVKGALDAMKTKTKSMELLVQLYLTGYFSEPNSQRTLIKNKMNERKGN